MEPSSRRTACAHRTAVFSFVLPRSRAKLRGAAITRKGGSASPKPMKSSRWGQRDPPCTRTARHYRAPAMTLLDKLERRFGFLAIPGLIRIVIGFTALVYVLVYLNRGFESFLTLDSALILRGQVWRLVTYSFIPQTFSPLWLLLALWFLWFIGEGLERAWGSFRLTLYFFVGMIGTTIAAFFFGSNFSNGMLITSLFFAFARFYPEEVIYILFILPVKIKWLAWIYASFLLLGFFFGSKLYGVVFIYSFIHYF